jgi:predicted MFS family arabinose efflux permease
MLFGYVLWVRQTKRRGSRFVLLATTFGLALVPAMTAVTHSVELVALYAGLSGIFQAGLDLVLFDELMRTVPPKYSATFVSLAQSLQNLSSVLAPIVGTLVSTYIGLSGALIMSALVRLLGFALFAWSAQVQRVTRDVRAQLQSGGAGK